MKRERTQNVCRQIEWYRRVNSCTVRGLEGFPG